MTAEGMDQKEKIVRLEEQSWFQERLLSQLNEALTLQQKQLDAAERRIAQLEARVRELLLSMPQDAPENALPPHHMPERY